MAWDRSRLFLYPIVEVSREYLCRNGYSVGNISEYDSQQQDKGNSLSQKTERVRRHILLTTAEHTGNIVFLILISVVEFMVFAVPTQNRFLVFPLN